MARLAVFFDGTDNTPKDRTNVRRSYELLATKDESGTEQRGYYIKGVGTEVGEMLLGSIIGQGMANKICEGYEWVAKNFSPDAEIYVFGFSRGAFAARSLIQMIACCGLTHPDYLDRWSPHQAFQRYDSISCQETEIIPPIYRLRYWERHPDQMPAGRTAAPEEAWMLDDAIIRVVKIRMAGLWDTVGAIGTDALKNRGASTQKSAAHNVRPTKTQEYGYHALAIDSHRPMFDVTLWRTFVESNTQAEVMAKYSQYYEQRWFVGAHSDVGGGYLDDNLPDFSLAWMLNKASGLGLSFLKKIEPQPQGIYVDIHDSFKAFAGGALSIWDEFLPGDQRHYREIGRAPRTVQTDAGTNGQLWSINETIDESVETRWKNDPTYRPPGLVDYYRRNPTKLPANTTLAQRTKRILANQYWNETGVFVRANTEYRINLVPGIGEPLRDASFVAEGIDGEDWDSFPHKAAALVHGKRHDNAKWFALIGTIDKKFPWIVTNPSTFTSQVSGQLLCYFNDVEIEHFYSNNSGWIVLEIAEV